MNESLSLNLTQQTVQRLSPRQVQFVRLLEMTAPEVEEEVRRQLDDNPALETAEPADAPEHDSLDMSDGALSDDPDDDPADRYLAANAAGGSNYQFQVAADAPDLMTMLEQQLGETEMPERIKQFARYIIGNLDTNGYMTRTLTAMADDILIATGIEASPQEMRAAFDAVRRLDPAGVGAVDLRDCLLLQLDRMEPHTVEWRTAREIVANNFDLLSKKHYDRLQAELEITSEQLRRGIGVIRQLNPKPGSAVEPASSLMRLNQITPDVAVEETDDGRFSVSLVSAVPQLQIERSFDVDEAAMRLQSRGDKEAQQFIRMKRDDAEAFINALRQRGNTLLAVTEAIVRRQAEFFATGDESALKPMILKDIAKDTGYDLSTVSRATAAKYVVTPMGIYPLKMFFNEAPTDDSNASSHQIINKLQEIIENEDKRHPLSDQAILQHMEAAGYKLARRTITKYRERLGIPVGRLRRKL